MAILHGQSDTATQSLDTLPTKKTSVFRRANEQLYQYFYSYQGRGIFILLSLVLVPIIVVGQIWALLEISRQGIGGLTGTILRLSPILSFASLAFVARHLDNFIELGPLYRQRPQTERRETTPEPEETPYQEYRAQGQRVVVDGVAFQFGQSRRFFERAPWYRN